MNRYSDSLRLVVSMGDGYWLGWIIGFILLIAIIVLAIKIMNKKSLMKKFTYKYDSAGNKIENSRYSSDGKLDKTLA